MGQEHNELRVGPVSRAVRAALGVSDGESGVSRFGETLQPTIDLWARPEWELLRGEILFARMVISPAVALRFSGVELVNPANSGRLATLRGIFYQGGAGASLDVAVDSGAALGVTATARGLAMDTRFPQIGEASICTVVTGDFAAGVALNQHRFRSIVVPPPLPFVISPGFKLFFIGGTANEVVWLSLVWSERSVPATELQARG